MANDGRMALTIILGDKLTLPNDAGVETTYVIDRIEGTQFEAKIYLKNANGIPGDEKIVTYGRVD